MDRLGSLCRANWDSFSNSSAKGRFSGATEFGNKNKPAPNIRGRGLGLNAGGGGEDEDDDDAHNIEDEVRPDTLVTNLVDNALDDGNNAKQRTALMKQSSSIMVVG
mmetsp:Transcript_26755/g.50510  ORF Transcript_26755/g.50510 Transcript_26755/m.50510 type:complete len:106 (+) Transcript_26755:505-822(+)|eukprot:scaffold4097_cov166-Amphora_coffeaeformis.AAC.46